MLSPAGKELAEDFKCCPQRGKGLQKIFSAVPAIGNDSAYSLPRYYPFNIIQLIQSLNRRQIIYIEMQDFIPYLT